MEKKIKAGANYVITQLGYDVRKFAEVIKYLKYKKIDIPILGNVYALNKSVARLMNKGLLPGCVATNDLLQALEREAKSEDKGKTAKLERAAQLMAILKGLEYSGVHIGGFGLKPEDVNYIIERAGEIGTNWREYSANLSYHQKNEYYYFPADTKLSFTKQSLLPKKLNKLQSQPLDFKFSKLIHRLFFKKYTAFSKK